MNLQDFQEIERLAFLKYRLNGKKSMNTFIFTQAKTNKLTDKDIDKLIDNLNKRIKKHAEKQAGQVKFTCNLF